MKRRSTKTNGGTVRVRAHTRADGARVPAHTRKRRVTRRRRATKARAGRM